MMLCVIVKIKCRENFTVITQQFMLEFEKLLKDRWLK